jgi:hypothetical protein
MGYTKPTLFLCYSFVGWGWRCGGKGILQKERKKKRKKKEKRYMREREREREILNYIHLDI